MTTASDAFGVIRALMEANPAANPKTGGGLIPFRWFGEKNPPLPDTAAPFIFTVFTAMRSGVIETGGGRGRNRHRNPAEADIFVFVPNEWTQKVGTDLAEIFAALLRPYNQNGVFVEDATVYPGGPGSEIAVPGMDVDVGNYFWCGVGVRFYFDLVG
jgi:hypothetical protein